MHVSLFTIPQLLFKVIIFFLFNLDIGAIRIERCRARKCFTNNESYASQEITISYRGTTKSYAHQVPMFGSAWTYLGLQRMVTRYWLNAGELNVNRNFAK